MSMIPSPYGPVLKWGTQAQRDHQHATLNALAEQYLADEATSFTQGRGA